MAIAARQNKARPARVLIYSHDTFGLGHLRRCRAIAHALVDCFDDMSVMILSGSPIIGRYEFRNRVDFVRIPGVIKLRDGDYVSLSLPLAIEETVAIRSSIIEHTCAVFAPDLFIVDKEPLGLRGEVLPVLQQLEDTATQVVLGLRDVMDSPEQLAAEWQRKGVYPALEQLYDQIWVYGPSYLNNPLDGITLPRAVHDKLRFTGYLRRDEDSDAQPLAEVPFGGSPFLLVTPGGGGDGVELVDWILRAYEAQARPLFPSLIVAGPFMPSAALQEFGARADRLRDVALLRFTSHMEQYMRAATAVVAMGGYNTFCELLSFDKPALLVPRVQPRREQAIRAEKAATRGLVQMLAIDEYPRIEPMVNALAALPSLPPPSRFGAGQMLGGLTQVCRLARTLLPPIEARGSAAFTGKRRATEPEKGGQDADAN